MATSLLLLRPHPLRLASSLFETSLSDDRDNNNTNLRTLSDGLRLFGNNLATLPQAETVAVRFQKAADDVDRAADVLHRFGSLANDRVASAMHHLKHCNEQLFNHLENDGFIRTGCIAEIYGSLLNEREALRINRSGFSRELVSDGYSRLGDVLTFLSNHEMDLMACIIAHRTIQNAYAMAAAPAPGLHYRHRISHKNGCHCVFLNFWSGP